MRNNCAVTFLFRAVNLSVFILLKVPTVFFDDFEGSSHLRLTDGVEPSLPAKGVSIY